MGKKKILLAMGSTDQYYFRHFEGESFEFVRYDGLFGTGELSKYLQDHGKEIGGFYFLIFLHMIPQEKKLIKIFLAKK